MEAGGADGERIHLRYPKGVVGRMAKQRLSIVRQWLGPVFKGKVRRYGNIQNIPFLVTVPGSK